MASRKNIYTISEHLSSLIQYVSFIAAVLVVYIHVQIDPERSVLCAWIKENISLGICSVAVPVFFAISGFLFAHHIFENGWWRKELSKKFKTVFLPYLLINAVFFPFVFICNRIGMEWFGAKEVFSWNFTSFVSGFGFNPFTWPGLVQSWFLRSLFLLFILSPVFAYIVKCGKIASVSFLILSGGLFYCLPEITDGRWNFFFNYTFSILGVFNFFLGMVLRVHFIGLLNQIASKMKLPRLPALFAYNTMPLYLIHPIILFCIDISLKPFDLWWICCTAEAFVPMGIFLIFASLFLAAFSRKHFPRFFNLFFGGR